MDNVIRVPPEGRSWDTLANALVRLSAAYTEDEEAYFVRDVGFLYAGLPSRSQEAGGFCWDNGVLKGNTHLFLQRGLLAEEYFVRPNGINDGDYNVHHWAWSFAMGYDIGEYGALVNTIRESLATGATDESDLLMGAAGVFMGDRLAWPSITYSDIPDLLSLTVFYGSQ